MTTFFLEQSLDASFLRQLASITRLTEVKVYFLYYQIPLTLPSEKTPLLSSIKRLTLEIIFADDSPVRVYGRVINVDYPAFFQGIVAWFPALAHLTLLVKHDILPAMQASLDQIGKLPFSVKISDVEESLASWYLDW